MRIIDLKRLNADNNHADAFTATFGTPKHTPFSYKHTPFPYIHTPCNNLENKSGCTRQIIDPTVDYVKNGPECD